MNMHVPSLVVTIAEQASLGLVLERAVDFYSPGGRSILDDTGKRYARIDSTTRGGGVTEA
jgi:hypothetical protein